MKYGTGNCELENIDAVGLLGQIDSVPYNRKHSTHQPNQSLSESLMANQLSGITYAIYPTLMVQSYLELLTPILVTKLGQHPVILGKH